MLRSWRQLAVVLMLSGCNQLPQEKCAELRSQAFDMINGSHTCMEDADCTVSHWPGCPKPINLKTEAKVEMIRDELRAGRCDADSASSRCQQPPGAYCDRNFCILRTRSAGAVSSATLAP